MTADPVTAAYLAEAAVPGSPLPTVIGEVRLPPALMAVTGGRLLPRPLFVAEDRLERCAADVRRLFELLTTLPQRMFDGDLHRYCAALGIGGRKERLLTRGDGTPPPLYGRADLAFDGEQFRLLEFNVGSEIGGIDRSGAIPALLAGAAGLRAFTAEHRLAYHDTGRLVAEALRAAARPVAPQGAPVVALLEGPGGLARFGPGWQALAQLMRGLGLDFLVSEVNALRRRGDRLAVDGRTVDLVLRCFTVEEVLAHSDGEAMLEPLLRAHDAGTTVLWTPLESQLFDSKGCLALLWKLRRQGGLAAQDAALVDRLLPDTRALPRGFDRDGRAARAAAAGPPPDLLEYCMEYRQELILKPFSESGGEGIVAGWEVDEARWRRALADTGGEGAVVQRRAATADEPVVDPLTGVVRNWHAVWGLFMTPAGHAGCYGRAVPRAAGSVIGMAANAAACTAGVFTYPGAPGRAVRPES